MTTLVDRNQEREIGLPHDREPMTVDEYDQWFRSLRIDRLRVELIDGKIVEMSAQNDPHAWAMSRCSRGFPCVFGPDKVFRLHLDDAAADQDIGT